MTIRAAALSFALTPPGDWEGFAASVREIATRAAGRGVQLLVYPEYLSLGLELGSEPRGATFDRRVASDIPQIFTDLARRHGMWIYGGSHRTRTAAGVRNSGVLYGPRGEAFANSKVQRVPSELEPPEPVMPGDGFLVVETAVGRIAALTCYDVEFPEHARAAAVAGAEILLVPSWTETLAGFWRVRHCAHARGIEDQVYVIHSPLVGSLDAWSIDERGVGSAAVLGPCDPLISQNGVLVEGPMGSAGHLAIADLDLDLLATCRGSGAVRPLHDYLTSPKWSTSILRA
jgi:predicted amidohydrolase